MFKITQSLLSKPYTSFYYAEKQTQRMPLTKAPTQYKFFNSLNQSSPESPLHHLQLMTFPSGNIDEMAE